MIMQKKNKLSIILTAFFVISIGLWSCQWHTIEPLIIDAPTDTISFSIELEPLFVDKCSSCHTSRDPVMTDGNAYQGITNGFVNTSDPETSLIYTKMNDDQHPSAAGTFSQTQLVLLLTWIEQGALDN